MKKLSLILLIFVCFGTVFSQPPNGSYSLIHTQSARTFEKGRLELHTNMNFYTKLADYIGDPSLRPADFNSYNLWVAAGNIALTYGVLDHFDVTIAPRIYQDTQQKDEYNLPDDIFVTLKLGSFAFGDRKFYGAFLGNMRLPTGDVHNYPFTSYASGAFEFGLTGALSYYADAYLPERAWNVHLNLGWWNHNEAGEELAKNKFATKNSTEIQYALGFVYPTSIFDFTLELNGISYIDQPDPFVYAREDWMYITPSLRYKALSWLSFDLGVDIRVTGSTEESIYTFDRIDLPNYTSWQVQMGANITILPLVSVGKSSVQLEKEEFNKRVKFFQKILEDRQRSDEVQEELEKLKAEREAAERELEELKQILQEEGSY